MSKDNLIPSNEVLHAAFIGGARKVLAVNANVSISLINQFCLPKPSDEFPDGQGTRNPIDWFDLIAFSLHELDREKAIHDIMRRISDPPAGSLRRTSCPCWKPIPRYAGSSTCT